MEGFLLLIELLTDAGILFLHYKNPRLTYESQKLQRLVSLIRQFGLSPLQEILTISHILTIENIQEDGGRPETFTKITGCGRFSDINIGRMADEIEGTESEITMIMAMTGHMLSVW